MFVPLLTLCVLLVVLVLALGWTLIDWATDLARPKARHEPRNPGP